MVEKRQHQRIDCAQKCLLYHSDSGYDGAIKNLSISGAMVTLYAATSAITPGDTCSLILSNDTTTSFYRYRGRIIRVNATEVGLEILEHA